MADPIKYIPGYSYTSWQAANPTKPLPAPQVDNDFALLQNSSDQIVEAIKDIRRSDGKLQNGLVTPESLDPATISSLQGAIDIAADIDADRIATEAALTATQAVLVQAQIARDDAIAATSGMLVKAQNLADLPDKVAAKGSLRLFKSLAVLFASSLPALGVGAEWRAGEYQFIEAASGASDHHRITPGGVKLYSMPGPCGYYCEPFGAVGDGSVNQTDMYTAMVKLWDAGRANGVPNDYRKPGVYAVGDVNLPWRQDGTPIGLIDGIAVYGSPKTIFQTNSNDGADVAQINGIRNMQIFGHPEFQANLTGFAGSGCNAVSITNGGENIYLEVTCRNMRSIDKGATVDGGNGVTVQHALTVNPCGNITAKIKAYGCAGAFNVGMDLVTMTAKGFSCDVEFYAEDCYQAVVISAGAATGAVSASYRNGVKVRGTAKNCQKDLFLARAHGGTYEVDVVTDKTAAQRRLSPFGVAWRATDTEVISGIFAYAYNADVKLTGNKGECAYKERITGAVAGSSGLVGENSQCKFYFDLGGAPTVADMDVFATGGNTCANSQFTITPQNCTRANVPSLLKQLVNTKGNSIDCMDGHGRKIVTLTPGATVTPNLNEGTKFDLVPAQNFTLAAPTGLADYIGTEVFFRIKQDGTGSRVVTFDAAYKFPTNGTDMVLSTIANTTDSFTGYVANATDIIVTTQNKALL